MQTFVRDVRYSLRLLGRQPGFTLTAVAVLALGIGVNAGVFGLVNGLLLRPLPGEAAGGPIVGLYSADRTLPDTYRAFSYPNFADIRDAVGPFASVSAHNLALAGITEGETTRRALVDVVSAEYFETLGVRLARGRVFTREEERPGSQSTSVIASYPYWERHGFDPDILGRVVRVNGRDYGIVGVAPKDFGGTTALVAPELWLPLGVHELVDNDFEHAGTKSLQDRARHALIVVGRLQEGAGLEQADRALEGMAAALERAYPAENRNQRLLVRPLSRMGISASPTDDSQVTAVVALLQALAATVLVISCLNLANMLLAHGASRRKEMAIRQAIGVSRWRLIRQLLTEGLVLAILGGAAGLFVAYWATKLLLSTITGLLPVVVTFDPMPDVRVLAATIGFSALATVTFGLWPAWRLARTDTVGELKGGAGDLRGRAGRRFGSGNALVVAQIALSLALLVASGLFIRGALAGSRADAGFAMDRTVLARIDPSLAGYDEARGRDVYRSVLERLRSAPGVEAVAAASLVPFGEITSTSDVQRDGPPLRSNDPAARARLVDAHHYVVGADYFRALGIRVLRGRDFSPAEERHAVGIVPAIIDEPLARRLFGTDDPIGRRLRLALTVRSQRVEAPFEVVGLVAGTRHDLFAREPEPHLYVPSGASYTPGMNIHVRAVRGIEASALIETVRREIRAADAQLPVFGVTTLADFRDASVPLWLLRTAAGLFSVFGLSAVFVAVVGLYGVKSYVVSRRVREFGVRMALGASAGDILKMVFREGAVVAAAGLVLGLAAGAGLGVLVGSLLYQVSPLDPATFGLASAVLLTASLVAAWVPARRAGRVQPMAALRQEL